MEKVIVAVKRSGEARPRDLELPVELPLSDLTILISEALKWNQLPVGETYSIRVSPQGKILSPQQTLLSAVIRTGSTLEFIPSSQSRASVQVPPAKATPPPPTSGGVVGGFISLIDSFPTAQPPDSTQNQEDQDSPTPPSDQKGFTWKKIS